MTPASRLRFLFLLLLTVLQKIRFLELLGESLFSQACLIQVYVSKVAHRFIRAAHSSSLLPCFALAMTHTIQSAFLRKHCQLPVSSQLEQWDHRHPLILHLLCPPVFCLQKHPFSNRISLYLEGGWDPDSWRRWRITLLSWGRCSSLLRTVYHLDNKDRRNALLCTCNFTMCMENIWKTSDKWGDCHRQRLFQVVSN